MKVMQLTALNFNRFKPIRQRTMAVMRSLLAIVLLLGKIITKIILMCSSRISMNIQKCILW